MQRLWVRPTIHRVLNSAPLAVWISSLSKGRCDQAKDSAALEKGKNPENDEVSSAENSVDGPDQVESVVSQLNNLAVSANPVVPPSNSTESSAMGDSVPDVDKKIRALKKKIRLTEAQQQKTEEKDMKPEQLEKMAKLESWRKELKLLEDKRLNWKPHEILG